MDEVVLCLESIQQLYSNGDNCVKVILLIKGQLEVLVDERPSQLKAEDILIINRNQSHTIIGNSKNTVLLLELGEDYLKRECLELLECRFVCDSSSDDAFISAGAETDRDAVYSELKHRLMQILIASMNRHSGFRMEIKSLLFSLFAYLRKYFCVDNVNLRQKDDKESSVQHVLTYLTENYWQDLSLEMAAKHAYMSPTYFSRFFKKSTGVGFLNYLTNIRLDHAMADLLGTDESIMKISIRHGFASAKALSVAFKSKYGVLPSDYRNERKCKELIQKHEDIVTKYDINLMSSNFEFLQHLIHSQEDTVDTASAEMTIALNTATRQPIVWPAKIILVDSFSSLIKADTISQLRYVQQKLGFQYIYFSASDKTMLLWLGQWETFGFYDISSVLDLLYEIKLFPIFRVDYTSVKQAFSNRGGMDEFLKLLRSILERLSENICLKTLLEQSKFELYCSAEEESEEFEAFYSQVVRGLQGLLDQNCFGILALTDMSIGNRERLSQTLARLSRQATVPGFLSCYACPNQEEAADTLTEDYHSRFFSEMQSMEGANGGKLPDLYMIKWDTISGKNATEVTTFFRSALIFSTIIQVSPLVAAIGFHLSTLDTLRAAYVPEKISMALFLYRKVKRPVYFVLDALNRMGKTLLFMDENTVVTENGANEKVFASYYPCYINPSHILDYAYAREFVKQRTIKITGFEHGLYQIKTYVYDRESTSISRAFEKIGKQSFLDNEELEFLEGSLAPALHISEEIIKGDYLLHENIAFNGIMVVKFRKIPSAVQRAYG